MFFVFVPFFDTRPSVAFVLTADGFIVNSDGMARDPNELAKYAAALDALEYATAADRDDEADIDKATASLKRMMRRRQSQATPNKGAGSLADTPRQDGMAAQHNTTAYKGMSMSEAASAYLKTLGRSEKAIRIVEALVEQGWETTADHPEHSLSSALERRATNYGDVVKVGRGVWTHKDHLTPKQRAAIEHKQRTSRGMAQRKARGLPLGQPSKLTPEIRQRIDAAISGGDPIDVVAEKVGLATSTIRKWYKRDQISALRAKGKADAAGDPPQEDRPALKVVGGE